MQRLCTISAQRAYMHATSVSTRRIGVAFDIDGVLLRGYKPLPHARDSLLALARAHIPFIFLTNGGGELESVKAATLSRVLDLPVHADQVVLSHTPLRRVLGSTYASQRVLVMGCRDVMTVARSYGVTRPVSVPMLTSDDPSRYPFVHYDHTPLPQGEREQPFGCVAILHDPNDWGAEIQVAIDVIRGGWPLGSGGSVQRIPVYASNFDVIFAGTYPVPRLAAGSFIIALKAVWQRVCGSDLVVTQCGKPSEMTFTYAREQLRAWADMLAATSPYAGVAGVSTPAARVAGEWDQLFMIGDNPAADVQGANAAGQPWHSILVRTGVFTGESNDPTWPAKTVVPSVREAVDYVLSSQRR